MTLYHFVNCFALAYGPYVILAKVWGLSTTLREEGQVVTVCLRTGAFYAATKLAKFAMVRSSPTPSAYDLASFVHPIRIALISTPHCATGCDHSCNGQQQRRRFLGAVFAHLRARALKLALRRPRRYTPLPQTIPLGGYGKNLRGALSLPSPSPALFPRD